MIPLADTLTALGFVLALFAASRARSTVQQILVVGKVFGIGTSMLASPIRHTWAPV